MKKFRKYAGAPVRSTESKPGSDMAVEGEGEAEGDSRGDKRDSTELLLSTELSPRVSFEAGSREGDGGEMRRLEETLAGVDRELLPMGSAMMTDERGVTVEVPAILLFSEGEQLKLPALVVVHETLKPRAVSKTSEREATLRDGFAAGGASASTVRSDKFEAQVRRQQCSDDLVAAKLARQPG